MVVPLASIFAQHPPIATILPLIVDKVESGDQLAVLDAVQRVDDDKFKEQVLKYVVSASESRSLEVDPEIWEVYYELKTPAKLAAMRESAGSESRVRYDLVQAKHVSIMEDRNTLVRAGNTGHRTWESSLAITEYMCGHLGELDRGLEVLELGAGTGLVSLAMARLGISSQILATDGSGLVVDRLETAIADNGVGDLVRAELLDWSDLDLAARLPKHTFVVAGDILYGEAAMYGKILDLLVVLQPRKTWFCNPIRNAETYADFKRLCAQRGIGINVLASYPCESANESNYMYLVSVPPIPVELIELTL